MGGVTKMLLAVAFGFMLAKVDSSYGYEAGLKTGQYLRGLFYE